MTRIEFKHRKAGRSNFAILYFVLSSLLFVFSHNDAAGCDAVRQKVGGWDIDCLSDSRCLFFKQPVIAAGSAIVPAANELANNRSNGMLDRIGARITCGIIESRKAFHCMACFGNAIVDLPALITINVDQQFTTDDVYWQYYTHCDRWQVTFCDQLVVPHRSLWISGVIQRCRHTYLLLEFSAIENLPNGKLVTGSCHLQPACSDIEADQPRLSSWLSDFAKQPLAYYWNSIKALRRSNSQNGILKLAMNQLLDLLKTTSAQSAPAEVSSQ